MHTFVLRITMMRFTKRIFQWTIGICCGLYICLQLAMHLPQVQEWVGSFASKTLNDALGWDVSIKRVKIGLWNRIIIDDVYLNDRNDSTMLHASRIAAKLDVLPLLEGKISIANAQLFGTQIKLYQETEESKPNFQFIIDTFQSNDTTQSPIDLRIGSLLLRRVDIQWDQQWKEHKNPESIDFSHLKIKNLSITAHLRELNSDSLNLSIKKLSFQEKSDFRIKNISFDLKAGKKGGSIENLAILLPHSHISMSTLYAGWSDMPKNFSTMWLDSVSWHCEPSASIVPSDLKAFMPQLKNSQSPIEMETTIMGSEGGLNIPQMHISNGGSLVLDSRIFVQNVFHEPTYKIDIQRLQTTSRLQQYVTGILYGQEKEISPIVTALDSTNVTGFLNFNHDFQNLKFKIKNKAGNLDIDIKAKKWNQFSASISSPRLMTDIIMPQGYAVNEASFNINAAGWLKSTDNRPHIELSAVLSKLLANHQEYKDVYIDAELKNKQLGVSLSHNNGKGSIVVHASYKKEQKHALSARIHMDHYPTENILPHRMKTEGAADVEAAINLSATNIDNLEGKIDIDNFAVYDPECDTAIISPLSLHANTSLGDDRTRTIEVESPFLTIGAEGKFNFSTLLSTLSNALHKQLPNLVALKHINTYPDQLTFRFGFQDTTLLQKITGKKISIPQQIYVCGNIAGSDSINIEAKMPHVEYGKQVFRNTAISINAKRNDISVMMDTEKSHKKGYINWYLKTNAHDNRMRMVVGMDNHKLPQTIGELDITTYFSQNQETRGHDIKAWVAPTTFMISDSLWHIHPATITFKDNNININGISINTSKSKNTANREARGIEINGCISKETDDSVSIGLKNIDVGYVLSLVNFKAVSFDGKATGTVAARNLMTHPDANATLRVDNFQFNNADLGTLDVNANWGKTDHFLTLEAEINDPHNSHHSHIRGGFNIGDPERKNGLDLNVNTSNFNLAFINRFTKGILEDVEGRATGNCRIFGPFKKIDLEGNFEVNNASLSMPILGTEYRIHRDSVYLSPGEIDFKAVVHDTKSSSLNLSHKDYTSLTNATPHTGILNGKLNHSHFKNMSYAFDIVANNLLGYNFTEFGENSYYATCYTSGNINVIGEPGLLNVEVNATPESGTVFTYNVSTPEAITNADFITIKEHQSADTAQNEHQTKRRAEIVAQNTSSDLFLNFNLNLNPSAKIRLLMDSKTGEMAELSGSGRIMAKYHNKGKFNIYGTYRVHDGSYKIDIQDIISRDFKFQPDGKIVFGGNPMKADLNMKAIYTVNSVSLDDLATSPLGFSKTKVNCIMNLTGHPEHPMITFDFDLPEASEDERQMIRSIVSTEEERNIQAIYLLGLGRFFNFEGEGAIQSTSAMNSLVSSTLSAQLNQFISNAVGQTNWDFGTHLKTGEDGWRNMDVEGTFSGRLLDNRLLLAGNFGYREKYYTQRSFISDVTIEYLLTKNGNVSLKAYNQANDRYFVQSSMNTQGIGIQLKKDFNYWKELFLWLKKRKQVK